MISDSERSILRQAAAIIERETAPADGHITIRGFGTFRRVTTAPRKGRNPQTGEPVDVPAKSVLKFKAAKKEAE